MEPFHFQGMSAAAQVQLANLPLEQLNAESITEKLALNNLRLHTKEEHELVNQMANVENMLQIGAPKEVIKQ